MKITWKSLFILMIMGVVTMSACKKKDDTGDKPSDSTSSKITLKIDGANEIDYTTVNALVLGDKLVIGANKDNSDIQIIVSSTIAVGTYTSAADIGLSHGVDSKAIFTSATNMTSLSFVVSKHDKSAKLITGTFSIHYNDNTNSSTHTADGTFNVYYK